MAEISASLFYEVERIIKELIDQSELARMAGKHFDEESSKIMIKELKESIISELDFILMEGDYVDKDEDEDDE
jgi:hypothetical protein